MPHVLIITAPYYPDVTDELRRGAQAALHHAGATYDEATVPGAFEIPAAICFAVDGGKYHGYVALGCVVRGETSHYDYVCGESARGLQELALHHGAAIGYGILTVETLEQARIRAAVDHGNKGGDAANACLAMITLKSRFKRKKGWKS